MKEEPPAGAIDVAANLVRQLQRRAELLLAAEERVEVEPDRLAVDVRVEVEDVALDGRRVIFVEGGADADVRDALERAGEALEARRRDIDAGAGKELVRRIDVHGRETDLPPQTPAGRHPAVDEVRPAEGEIDDVHRPFADRLADERRRDADAAQLHVVDSSDAESVLGAGALQLGEVAFASGAEGEVAAD